MGDGEDTVFWGVNLNTPLELQDSQCMSIMLKGRVIFLTFCGPINFTFQRKNLVGEESVSGISFIKSGLRVRIIFLQCHLTGRYWHL